MDIPSVVEKISQKFEAKGITLDLQQVEERVRRLVEEFGVHITEAERTVAQDLAREHQISNLGGGGSQELQKIAGIRPGEWVTVEGKIVAIGRAPSAAISQSGIIADSSGAIRFVTWARANQPVMEYGKWYRIESAVVDEYRGAPNLKVHSGTSIQVSENEMPLMPAMTPITHLTPGVASLRAKMVQEWEPLHERMLQTGLLGDESGTIRFTIWKDEEHTTSRGSGVRTPFLRNGVEKEKLELDTVYNIYYASVDEYGGRLSLTLNTAMYLADEGDIVVPRNESTETGAIVHLGPGSGLIKRCPVEGCKRVLTRQNYCPLHEVQSNFRYDLRMKAVLDDGERARNILMMRELVETAAGITLEEAIGLAESTPLGLDEVFYRIRDAVLGRYVTCTGITIDRRMLVDQCTQQRFEASELAALLNRAGGGGV